MLPRETFTTFGERTVALRHDTGIKSREKWVFGRAGLCVLVMEKANYEILVAASIWESQETRSLKSPERTPFCLSLDFTAILEFWPPEL